METSFIDFDAVSSPIVVDETVVKNFMDGVSFKLTPLQKLRFVACSGIRGESVYYRLGKSNCKLQDRKDILIPELCEKTVAEVFDDAVKSALETDFWGTVEFALECRKKYFMRLNPQVILIMAAMHPQRVIESEKKENFGRFRKILSDVAERPDDLTFQFNFYKEKMGGKTKLPGIVKRAWADRLEKITRYQANKYKNDGIIDLIRIAHPEGKKNPVVDEIIKTGKVVVNDTEMTWEQLRSQGKTWKEIVNQLKHLPHMAALRNLVGMALETNDEVFMTQIMNDIKGGVVYGKQFPFRYYSAYTMVNQVALEKISADVKKILIEGLEECLQISIQNFPRLEGDTISLCDNSGSAWGAVTSEYGSMKCAIIGNLSGLITAYNCTGNGQVGVFGDRLEIYNVDKKKPLLLQLDEINRIGGTVGGNTENGIWIFFKNAMDMNIKYQNVFIYSDMQAGHGGLYGKDEDYSQKGFSFNNSHYIDVMKLVNAYRKLVHQQTNFFSVQIAGYDNSVIPECIYRGSVIAGWTGNEVVYAYELIKIWDEIEKEVDVILS